MCGIAGAWEATSSASDLGERVGRMADSLAHRGPDDRGVWVHPDAGVALGFRRLAILDLSPTGHQPMQSADGRFTVVFNGEIYNHADLRKELEQLGVRFRGTSDTEVLLAGAAMWGPREIIPKLWGMFAIALWDSADRSLLLARDRLGKKPLYYTDDPRRILFGSELKSLRAYPGFRPEIDRESLSAFAKYAYVPAPRTIFAGVHQLPPGHMVEFRDRQASAVEPFWDARAMAETGVATRRELDDDSALEELDVLLRDAVARRMMADVPLGAFLSGGIDSSAVVALMQAQSTRRVKTFSIGFADPRFNEAEAAKAVARHLGTDHTELYVTPEDALDVIPNLADIYDEPFADSSQIPTVLVSRLARTQVTVGLSGDGGDEVFGGYNRYAWVEGLWSRLRLMPRGSRHALARIIQSQRAGTWDRVYGPLERAIPRSWRVNNAGDKLHKLAEVVTSDSAGDLYDRLVSAWREPVVTGGHTSTSRLDDATLAARIPNLTERMMYVDLVTYLPDDILTKVDRASMSASLEARCPLLDHRVVEWAWRLPMRFKQRNGQTKWILRQLLHRYVPPAIVERPKAGFAVPIGEWLRGPLREWAEHLLDERRLRTDGWFDATTVRKAWAEHLGGARSHEYRLWTILMFQAWRDRWP